MPWDLLHIFLFTRDLHIPKSLVFLFGRIFILSSKTTGFILCLKGEGKTDISRITQTDKNPRDGN